LVRYEEVEAGKIDHALRFASPITRNEYVWPARHMASKISDTNAPPMGQRFRLRANYDVSSFSSQTRVIVEALKRHGMVLTDNANNWVLFGAPDDRWDVDQLRELRQLRPTDFEAVDVMPLKANPNSARIHDASKAEPPQGDPTRSR
jgi:muconolactone delta-isomerase